MSAIVERATANGQRDAAPAAPALSLQRIGHRYSRKGPAVLRDVDLDVAPGEVLALLGPSGCGKTTLLRIVAGLVQPSAGAVVMAGRDLTRVATHKRNIGLVHQNFALWPHLTVAENVAFGLEMRRMKKGARGLRVAEVLELVGLDGFEGRYPRQLSGGQQQRVALARALAFEPSILLLDEPLSSLDANLRHQLQAHLRDLQRTTGVTTVIVTHDREEAMGVSSRVVVLSGGEIQQAAPASELYRNPASAFVMRFTGETNLLDGRITDEREVVVDGLGLLPAPAPDGLGPSDRVSVGVRPEHIGVHTGTDGHPRTWFGRVADAAFLGPFATCRVELDGGPVLTARRDTAAGADWCQPGDPVRISIPDHAWRVFVPEEDS